MVKKMPKPCRGCGGPKDSNKPRAHFCSKCAASPRNRPLLQQGKCRKGHSYAQHGIVVQGKRWRCKECERTRTEHKWQRKDSREKSRTAGRRNRLLRKFGLSEEDWLRMYDYQEGKCAICGSALKKDADGKGKQAAVDHAHKTGLIRGLVCRYPCNYILGFFHDKSHLFRACANYLESPPAIKALGSAQLTPGKKSG